VYHVNIAWTKWVVPVRSNVETDFKFHLYIYYLFIYFAGAGRGAPWVRGPPFTYLLCLMGNPAVKIWIRQRAVASFDTSSLRVSVVRLNFADSSCLYVHIPTRTPNRSNAHENANFLSLYYLNYPLPTRYTHLWYQIIPPLSANTLNPRTQIFIFTHWCHLELVSVKRAWNHFQQSLVSPFLQETSKCNIP
jgi:hypothetical protein